MKYLFCFVLAFITTNPFFVQNASSQEIKPEKTSAPYSSIHKLNVLYSEESKITIKVFETGGGDPAMNGDLLILNICELDPAEKRCFSWKTGINIYQIKSIRAKKFNCIIACTEHQTDELTGRIKTVGVEYIIYYYFDENGKLKDVITVEKLKT